MAKKTPGIYIAIRGDVSAFEADLHRARQIAKTQGEAIAKSMGNAVSAADLTGGITKLTRELKTAQAALSTGAFKAQVSGLEDIAKAAGVSSKQLEGLTNSMLKSQAAATANRAFEYLQKNAGLSATALAKLRRELGDTEGALKTAMGALNARPRSAIVSEMKDIVAAYREVKNSADATANDVKRAAEAMRGSLKKLASEARATKVAPTVELTPLQQALASIQRSSKLTTQEIDRLSAKATQFAGKRDMEQALARIKNEAGLSAAGMAKLQLKVGDTEGAFKTLRAAALPVVGTVTAIGAAAIYAGKACFDAALDMDRLQKSYRTVMGSDVGATTQLDYIYGLTQKLGLQFQSTAESAKGFFAASVGTSLEDDMNDIFKGVISAGTALSMTQDQMSGVFLAFSQIASKGKLSMEEVNQIAERLPGTFELVSKAMGVPRQEMFKMIEQGRIMSDDLLPKLGAALQEKFGDKAVEAAEGAQGAVNKLSTEWERLKASILDSDTVIDVLNAISFAFKGIANGQNRKNIETEMENAGVKSAQKEYSINPFTSSVLSRNKYNYLDEEVKAWINYGKEVLDVNGNIDLVLAARFQKQREYESERQASIKRAIKIEQDGIKAWKDATKDLPAFKIEAIDKAENEALKKLKQWHKKGTLSEKEYQEKKKQIQSGYAEKRKEIADKGVKSAEAAANRAATALAAYDAELAKLMKSSRDVEQVKIEEKLRKIAKDAKLPAEALEELRHAMEQEANFKWMQGILSYADPAAAAIAKVDREYQDFLRDVQSLKKEDPEKYTQLMAKAETEHEKALRKATRAGKEQTDHTQEKLAFYKELEELTGQYGLSLKYQNALLNEQVELWRDADIPEDYINKMRELRELQMSRDWVDGAKRGLLEYRASASDTAKGVEESFKGLFDGMDSGWKSSWQQMIETGKMSLSSFRSLFASFLADLLHMAITRPITVQIAGVVSGMFGAGGGAQAAGGAGGGGGIGNLSGLSNLLPTSWTSGIADTINNTMAAWFPNTFSTTAAASAMSNVGVMSATGGAADIAGLKAAEAAMLGKTSAGGTFLSAVSPYLMAGGLGSLGYSLLGGAIGLPQSKYSGITSALGSAAGWGLGSLAAGSSLATGTSLAAGAAFGSVIPVVGTILGAVGGGLLGSVFGGRKPKRPAVWGGVEINLGNADAYRDGSYDFGAAFDRKGYGKWDFEVAEGGYYAIATRDRENAGAAISQAMNAYLKQVADAAVVQAQTLQKALPDEYASQFAAGLSKHTIKASYDLKGSDISEEKMQEIAEDLQRQVADAMFAVYRGMDFSGYAGKITVDKSSIEGMTKFTQAVVVVDETLAAAKELRDPTSEWVTAAKQAVAQMEAWQETMRSTGVTADYAASLMDEYRGAYRDNFLKQLDEMFAPSLSEVERQAKSYREAIEGAAEALKLLGGSEEELAKVRGYTQTAIDNIISSLQSSLSPMAEIERARQNANAVIDQHLAALRQLGASEGEIARVEALRAEAVAQATAELLRSFGQNMAQRWAALDGTSDEVGRAISQENELREAVLKFGEGSAQVAALLKLHAAETAKAAEEAAKAAQEAAKSEYEALKSQMDALEQQRVQLQQQAIQEEISALNEQLSAAKTLRSTWEGLDKSLGQSRYNLFAGSANLDAENRLGTVQAEFRRLSGLAMGGDSEAAGQLAGVGSSLLDLVKQTAGTEEDYLDAFWAVNAQLKNAQDVAGAQVSSADKQLEALQGQLDVQNAALEALQGQSATLEEIEKQIAALRPVLEAAGQKVGIKAFASGGLALPGWALVGEKGPELVNFSQPGRVYTAADTAALFRSATPRAADAGSREEVKALREEVYQFRRDMNLLLNEIAKYGRRTSDTVEGWDAEGMPGVRA